MSGIYDIFVCHASEDKEQVARPLADMLRSVSLSVWYDEFSLKLGDSLRESIDRGLAGSRYGLVILSPNFFEKKWPQNELNGLFSLETTTGENRILPIWHGITQAEVVHYSPILADRVAVPTTLGLEYVLERVLDVIDPGSQHRAQLNRVVSISPLSARLHTGEYGVRTPVTVSNPAEVPAYAVAVRILIQGEGVSAGSIEVDTDSQDPPVEEVIGDTIFSADQLRLNCSAKDGKQIVLLILHTIHARGHRTFSIKGTVPVNSTAEMSIGAIDDKPGEILTRRGQELAVKFKPTEDLTVNGVAVKTRRRA